MFAKSKVPAEALGRSWNWPQVPAEVLGRHFSFCKVLSGQILCGDREVVSGFGMPKNTGVVRRRVDAKNV